MIEQRCCCWLPWADPLPLSPLTPHPSLLPPKHRLEPLHLPLVLLYLLLTDHHLVQQVLRSTRHLCRPPLQLAEQKQFRLAFVNGRALKLGQVTQDRKIQSALEYLVFGQPVLN
jgi:hypothetical protein